MTENVVGYSSHSAMIQSGVTVVFAVKALVIGQYSVNQTNTSSQGLLKAMPEQYHCEDKRVGKTQDLYSLNDRTHDLSYVFAKFQSHKVWC